MSLLANVPTLSYIQWKNLLITYIGTTYQIENNYTNKPYIYWDANNPRVLTASNTKLSERSGLFYIIFNDSGIYTIVPNDDVEIHFSENPSRDAITEKIIGLSNETNDRFTAIQIDIDGIKSNMGNPDGNGGGDYSKIEQRVDSIDLEVKSIQRKYSEDAELVKMREEFSASLLSLQSTLGLFSSDMNTYMEDNELTDEEKNEVTAYKTLLEEKRVEFNSYLSTIETYLRGLDDVDVTKIINLNNAKDELNTSINNLFTNIDTVCTDNLFTNTEITTIITYFGKVNLEINECKNLVDECIFLGVDGSLIEEVSSIALRQNEIKLNVKKIENDYVSEATLEQTAEQIKSEIVEIQGDYVTQSTLAQTAEQIKSDIKKIEDDYVTESMLEQTAEQIKSEVVEIQGDYVTQSTLTQTTEQFEFKISQSGVGNLIINGRPNDVNSSPWRLGGSATWYSNAAGNCGLMASTINECYAFSNKIQVKGNRNFSFSCKILPEVNTNGCDIYILGYTSANAGDAEFSQVVSIISTTEKGQWIDVKKNFTLSDDIKYFLIRIDNNGRTSSDITGGIVTFFTDVMILEGHDNYPSYRDSFDGISNNIVSINRDGINVANNSADTNTSITTHGFYINQNGHGDVFKVDSNGVSLSQGLVSLNKDAFTMRSNTSGLTTSINSHGFYISQDGYGDIFKVDLYGISLSQGIVALSKDGLYINSSTGGIVTLTNGNGFYINQNGYGEVFRVDSNGINIGQGGALINKDRIRFTHANGSYSEMNASGLIHYEGSNARTYHYLVYGGEYTCFSEETVTIALPDEFKGKGFSVITAVKRIYTQNNTDMTGAKYPLLSFYAEALNHDYINGTFQIYASIRAWNRTGTSGFGTMVGDGNIGTTEANLIKPVVAYWVFV